MSNQSELEVVLPYGNGAALQHFRFEGDYKTFCGRKCEGWTVASMTVMKAVASFYTCKHCLKALHK